MTKQSHCDFEELLLVSFIKRNESRKTKLSLSLVLFLINRTLVALVRVSSKRSLHPQKHREGLVSKPFDYKTLDLTALTRLYIVIFFIGLYTSTNLFCSIQFNSMSSMITIFKACDFFISD